MNIFRLAGDMSHSVAILLLLWKILNNRSAAGLSGKSQILFALVFLTRYLDLFLVFISVYNSMMKGFYLFATFATLYLIYFKFRSTYRRSQDTFRFEILIVLAAVLSFFVNHQFVAIEILWTFSIYLEALAILPQLFMLSKIGEIELFMMHYLLLLGSYRAFYIFNWVYRYVVEDHIDVIAVVAGVVQTLLYCSYPILVMMYPTLQPKLCISNRKPSNLDSLDLFGDPAKNLLGGHDESDIYTIKRCEDQLVDGSSAIHTIPLAIHEKLPTPDTVQQLYAAGEDLS